MQNVGKPITLPDTTIQHTFMIVSKTGLPASGKITVSHSKHLQPRPGFLVELTIEAPAHVLSLCNRIVDLTNFLEMEIIDILLNEEVDQEYSRKLICVARRSSTSKIPP